MKKIFFLLILCFSFISNIYAEEYSCIYNFPYKAGIFPWQEKDTSLEFNVNLNDKTISYPKTFFNSYSVHFMDYYVNDIYTNEYIIDSLNGGCPKNVVIGPMSYSGIYGFAIFFEESNFYLLKKVPAGYALPEKFIVDNQMLGAISDYIIGSYDENKSTGEMKDSGFGCDYYDKTVERLRELDCKREKCNLEQVQEFNDKVDKVKTFCSSVTENANYGVSYCLPACLSLTSESIFELSTVDPSCGFSNRLLVYVGNIIRIAKYIIPVIVIVLGILDFIKAIGADKEDEIKKAQGRFVKRLIAAALIFLIPFIIEFVLKIAGFGMYIDGCGVIDL